MSHSRPRGALLSLLLAGFAATGNIPKRIFDLARNAKKRPEQERESYIAHNRSRGSWGQGKKRYFGFDARGRRVELPPGTPRPAARWLANKKGHRWDHGHLIPRFMLRRGRA